MIGSSEIEIENYCEWAISKGKYALYYLTDMSSTEINLIFKLLNTYALDFTKAEILGILSHVYPDLYKYLLPYDYKNDLLTRYFEDYKYQKVINKVFSEFLVLVEEQAIKREYNLLLPARSEKIESINMKRTLVYFVDAMGVEYLSYIMEKCKEKKLMAYTTLCHCEIPSITSLNKEFIEVFEKGGATFAPDKNGVKVLDDIKHHGEEDIEDGRTALPTHLSIELQIIKDIIGKAYKKLQQNAFDRVVLISDHGASRLSVISNQENQHQMATSGIHSGRCCPKSESDVQLDCAIDGENFWVLANYDRFKGSRKANIEVHGGATLEEVVIPIIEITKPADKYEFEIITKKVIFSKRKKNAFIKIFSKTKLDEINVRITGIDGMLDASSSDGQNFTIAIPEMKNSGDYKVDVYLRDNLIFGGLDFHADNSDFKEKKLL